MNVLSVRCRADGRPEGDAAARSQVRARSDHPEREALRRVWRGPLPSLLSSHPFCSLLIKLYS